MVMIGLIGKSLGHSFSKDYFESRFKQLGINEKYVFKNFELESTDEVPELINYYPDLIGFNVTIPFKEQIISQLTQIESQAQQLGAVNTVVINRGSNEISLEGYNTDIIGFRDMLLNYLSGNEKKALVLGSGGASKAVNYVLKNLGIDTYIVSRSVNKGDLVYEQLDDYSISEYQIVVNTTPVGTYPNVNDCPTFPYSGISSRHLCIDLIYNPPLSRFLQLAESQGAKICNGYEMLVSQAEASWSLYHKDRK